MLLQHVFEGDHFPGEGILLAFTTKTLLKLSWLASWGWIGTAWVIHLLDNYKDFPYQGFEGPRIAGDISISITSDGSADETRSPPGRRRQETSRKKNLEIREDNDLKDFFEGNKIWAGIPISNLTRVKIEDQSLMELI